MVDGYNKDEISRKKLLEAEQELFKKIRKHMEDNNQEWSGSREQNREVDLEIASKVKASFKMYEKGKRPLGHFFEF